ncbi:MAG: hypothetical protein ABI180_01905 [Microcoleus sp.]
MQVEEGRARGLETRFLRVLGTVTRNIARNRVSEVAGASNLFEMSKR